MDHVILDFDAGVDDTVALLLLLDAQKHGKLKIEAIVATNGNASIENVILNTTRVLQLANVTNIPIYKGVAHPIIKPTTSIEEHLFHGKDGFGDLEHDFQPDLSKFNFPNESAVMAMGRIAKQYPGQVTIIAIGPLTNTALFLRIFGHEVSLKEIAIMGGNHKAVGNSISSAEFNFYLDPEAARIVLEYDTCPILILPWETCISNKSKISLDWRFKTCINPSNAALSLVQRAERKVYVQSTSWAPCDALLVGCFLNRSMIVDQYSTAATVETQGNFTRGQTVIDHCNTMNRKKLITIVTAFDTDVFKELVYQTI